MKFRRWNTLTAFVAVLGIIAGLSFDYQDDELDIIAELLLPSKSFALSECVEGKRCRDSEICLHMGKLKDAVGKLCQVHVDFVCTVTETPTQCGGYPENRIYRCSDQFQGSCP